jgi:tetratricopeptide (TPR) repeat protein
MRQFNEAEQNFLRVWSLSPEIDRSYAYRIRIRFRLEEDIAGAREIHRQAQKASMGTNRFLYQVLLLELSAGDYRAALNLLASNPEPDFGEQLWYVPRPLLEAQIRSLANEPEPARRLYEEARRLLEARVRETPDDPRYRSSLGIALAGLGRKQEAIREGLKAVELMPVAKEAYRGTYRLEDFARIYAMVGEKDAALERLEQLVSIPCDLGAAALKLDPAWASLRDHPRFQAMVRKLSQ